VEALNERAEIYLCALELWRRRKTT
jgi:hypothetical protein